MEVRPTTLIDHINSPADLRALKPEQLPQVCRELRRYILEVLSVTPGHLGSSLGAVDFTVALHYVFDTPYDRIVWDVGHQAYSHKILTGRREDFRHLRQWGASAVSPRLKKANTTHSLPDMLPTLSPQHLEWLWLRLPRMRNGRS